MDLAYESSYPTPVANSPLLLTSLLLSLMRQKHSPDVSERMVAQEYDYIIVGAGSSGATIASRLSELKCVSVLLLEAGKSPPVLTDVPGYLGAYWTSDISWNYKTVPQKHTGNGLNNNQIAWPSGKALGGSSIFNGMQYVRGNKKNYDDWAEHGAKGWSYDEVLPYFIKSEDNRNIQDLDKGFHGVGGPLSVERPKYVSEIKSPILETALKMGYKSVDINGFNQTGFFDTQGNLRDQQRCSTAKAYLVPAENRPNLDIVINAFVKKILIEGNRATGVVFDYRNASHQVKARREVLMAAGATNTAQLLMLSGIGPRDHLEKLGIPVIADLPVGNNMQDHCSAFVSFQLDSRIPAITEKLANTDYIKEYINNRTGPLTTTAGVAWLAFLNSDSVHPTVDFPNYQLYFGDSTTDIFKYLYNLKPEVYKKVYEPYENKPYLLCASSILNPKSRGTLRLNSTDPFDPPLIDPNYFSHPQDTKDIVEGLKMCNKILKSEALKKIGAKPIETLYPGCEALSDDEDRYLVCMTQSVIATMNHECGTATMGDPKDPTTVVDPKLRVKGIKGLRVVDASIMPIIPSGNTNIPVIMVAEKASDIIKEDIKC